MNLLDHPNIVKFFGAAICPATVILQFITGKDLFNFMHTKSNDDQLISLKQEDFPWNMRFQIALDITYGVDYLQSFTPPIVHRDLRSPNIFLTAEGSLLLPSPFSLLLPSLPPFPCPSFVLCPSCSFLISPLSSLTPSPSSSSPPFSLFSSATMMRSGKGHLIYPWIHTTAIPIISILALSILHPPSSLLCLLPFAFHSLLPSSSFLSHSSQFHSYEPSSGKFPFYPASIPPPSPAPSSSPLLPFHFLFIIQSSRKIALY